MSEFPKYEFLNEKKTREMLEKFRGERSGWVLVGEKQYFFPMRYVDQGKGFFEFKARPSDTWVMSYPRSGTTWTQELVWLLSNNLDFETASKKYLAERFPFLEFSMFNHPEVTEEFVGLNEGNPEKQEFCRKLGIPGYEVVGAMPPPRFIKSHFPFSLMPGILDVGCKIIYVARNPKDVAVSWYHLNRDIKTQGYNGTFEEFWDYFENNLTPWSPYWAHLKEAWALRDHENLLFLFYEEMQQNLTNCIHKVSKFLNKNYSNEEILKLCDYLDIKNFKNNPMVNSSELRDCKIISDGSFVRNGKSGAWNEIFNEKLRIRADEWIKKNLEGSDFVFPTFNNNY